MFEFIRTHQRLMQILLAVLILPSLVLFGNPDVLRSFGKEEGIAKVAGAPITQAEFDQALRDQLDRMRQMYGPQFDAKMLNTLEARQSILDEMIDRKAIAGEIAVKKLTIADATLQDKIATSPGMLKADGHFNNEEYTRVLAQQGMTPLMFEQRLRQDMVLQQLLAPVQAGAFVPKTVAERFSAINEQEREVQMLMYKPGDFADRVKITDEMLKAYYEKNSAQFEIPEQINAEYVVLNSEVLAEQTTVSDADVQTYYKANEKSYTTEEQRRASHILIAVAKDSSAADKAKAKAKAADILTQLRKKPEDFAKLAKENSDDPGSKEKGGDLDFFGKGMMVPQFDESVFKLKQGDISELVQSDYGFHIITVTGIKPAGVKTLDEVKVQIAADIKKQKAGKAYTEAAETFTNVLYEQGDSLKPAAEKLKLKIQTVNGLSRNSKPGLPATMETNNPKFLKAIFSDDVVKKKHNTEAVEVAPNTLIAGRIVEYKAASKRPFEEVKASIQAQVTATEAAALAEKEGVAKLAALKAADATAGFTEAKMVSRLKNQDIPPAALLDLMRADTQKLPAFVGTSLGTAGYVIFRIGKVSPGTPDKERRASEAQQLAGMQSSQNLYAYLELLKQRAKVTINKAAIAAPVTAAP
ncbi:MAG: SurA N-terminal domain-containing protein [Undibacterium umbellatum]|uniref:SurA N-terminal domain-containing protein n=1 Tax=Undibacterium umbellatum TaxID=2762300 RepID=UPI003BB5333A